MFLGSVTKPVPVTNANKAVMFSYDYAFTSDDLAVGKVSFQTVASKFTRNIGYPGYANPASARSSTGS